MSKKIKPIRFEIGGNAENVEISLHRKEEDLIVITVNKRTDFENSPSK